MLKWDIQGWKRQMEEKSQIILRGQKNAHQKACSKLYRLIVQYTPIGAPETWKYPPKKNYTPGFLRSNWKMYINGKETNGNVLGVQLLSPNLAIIISNDAPYAYRIETGWSQQAPEGMMRKAIMQFPKLLEQSAKEEGL